MLTDSEDGSYHAAAFLNLCDEYCRENITDSLPDRDQWTIRLTPEGLDSSAVTRISEAAVRYGYSELTALLLEKFHPVAEDEFGQPIYNFTPGG